MSVLFLHICVAHFLLNFFLNIFSLLSPLTCVCEGYVLELENSLILTGLWSSPKQMGELAQASFTLTYQEASDS